MKEEEVTARRRFNKLYAGTYQSDAQRTEIRTHPHTFPQKFVPVPVKESSHHCKHTDSELSC